MTKTASAATARHTVPNRSGNSRKLLARKAMERATAASQENGDSLEDSFPSANIGDTAPTGANADQPDHPPEATASEAVCGEAEPVGQATVEYVEPNGKGAAASPAENVEKASDATVQRPAITPAPVAAPSWSAEDERALQTMQARRKAAGFQRRGRDVGGQMVCVGDIAPNSHTVVGEIVSIVAASGIVSRRALLEAMASPQFAHPKTKASDSWRQGYIAGALRDGFLAVVPTVTARTEVEAEK